MAGNADTGIRGEAAATEYLMKRGFTIHHCNWRMGRYEIDIVAEHEGVLHFVEVKCRKAGALTLPEEAMTRAKYNSVCKAANAYIEQRHWQHESQIDLIAVDWSAGGEDIRYYPDVMASKW